MVQGLLGEAGASSGPGHECGWAGEDIGLEDREIVLGNLRVDVGAYQAYINDGLVALTAQEFQVLALLASEAGRLVSQEALAAALWRDVKLGYTRHLGVVVTRLRAKLTGAHPYRIETVRKRGFGLVAV